MKGYRKVLIALNGSKPVLEHGLTVAAEGKCWVTVVKVLPEYDGDIDLSGIGNLDDVLDSGERNATHAIRTTADAAGMLVKARVERGNVSSRILEAAEEERADLIVIGTPKRKGFFGRLLGDRVVERVLDRAPCPVLVVGTA